MHEVTRQPHSPWRSAILMTLSAVLFGLMALTIRLSAKHLHAFEIAFFRNFFGLFFALPLLLRHGRGLLHTNQLRMYFLRCVVGLCAMLTGFWALVHLPLAQAVALSYTTPLFVTIGAVLVLGEVVRIRRWSAVFIGFVGVIIILHPSPASFSSAALIAVLSSVFSASAAISIKLLSRTERSDAIVFYMVLIMTPLSLIPALPFWQWPSTAAWGWLMLTGLFGTSAHTLLTRAYKMGDASALQAFNFMQLPVVALGAYWLFAETIDAYTIVGSVVIFLSTIYIAHREVVLSRRAITDETIASHVTNS
jgi:drug/metabolite transporter (DMT)-like permease